MGRISREEADRHAEAEYERFAQRRREQAEAEGLKLLEQAATQFAAAKKQSRRKRNT